MGAFRNSIVSGNVLWMCKKRCVCGEKLICMKLSAWKNVTIRSRERKWVIQCKLRWILVHVKRESRCKQTRFSNSILEASRSLRRRKRWHIENRTFPSCVASLRYVRYCCSTLTWICIVYERSYKKYTIIWKIESHKQNRDRHQSEEGGVTRRFRTDNFFLRLEEIKNSQKHEAKYGGVGRYKCL